MDKATVLGLVVSLGLILTAMALGGSILMFLDAQSVLIVLGGTLGATLTKERMAVVLSAFKVGMQAVRDTGGHDLDQVLQTILQLSKKAREAGVLALEGEEMPSEFMAKGLRLVTDGLSPDDIEAALQAERISLINRHRRGRDVFKFMAGTAPSMGMIGTLVGLVAMLQKLDNPSAIGPAMAVALLTTLYGAIVAFAICSPIAEKLQSRTSEEAISMEVALFGFSAIARGDRPMVVKERLESYLAPPVRRRRASAEGA